MNLNYRIRIFGVDFNGTTNSQSNEFINCSVDVSLMDCNGSYSIE